MKIFAPVLIALSFVGSSFKAELPQPQKRVYISHYENVLGTSLELKFTTLSEADADNAEVATFAEINRLSAIFSAYDSNSEFSRWMKQDLNKSVKVSNELFTMLDLFQQWKLKTNGALDASAALAVKVWADAAKHQVLPSKQELNTTVAQMAQQHYKLDHTNQTATRLTSIPLVMNTFAKSYIINEACIAALKTKNVIGVIVNIGGDLVIKGDITDKVNVTNPKASAENDVPITQLLVANSAVATSGNYRRGEEINGKWYSHIVDPRTALPVNEIISATVVAPNATDAGALATAFNVLSITESKKLATTIAGAEYLIITKNGDKIESTGWKKLEAKTAEKTNPIAALNYGKAKPWDAKFELAIDFTLNKIEGNGHRPFAAIWVEDENKVSIRNLALWYNKTKWIPDLKNWYRINGDKFKENKENFASATGATRNPGAYTIKWDGKDDAGNFVAQGKYTIIIETAKEHGTNEIIRQQMEFKKSAVKATNLGNVEVASVNFDFHKKQ